MADANVADNGDDAVAADHADALAVAADDVDDADVVAGVVDVALDVAVLDVGAVYADCRRCWCCIC